MYLSLLLFVFIVCGQSSSALPIFEVFNSKMDAQRYYQEEYEPVLAGVRDRQEFLFLDESDEDYRRVKAILVRVQSAFVSLYGDKIQVAGAPSLLVIDSRKQMAAVLPLWGRMNKMPYLLLFSKGLLEFSDSEITGIIAHELSHLHLQWKNNGVRYPKSRYYMKTEEKLFGESIRSDATLESAIKRKEGFLSYSGPFLEESFLGVPLHYDAGEISPMREIWYLLDSVAEETEVCRTAKKHNNSFIRYVINDFFSYSSLSIDSLSFRERAKIRKKAEKLELLLQKCLAGVRYSYTDLVNEVYGIPKEVFKSIISGLSPAEKEVFHEIESYYDRYDVVDAILLYTKRYREKAQKITEVINMEQLRVYTYEDHADEKAIEVLFHMGLSADSLNSFLLEGEGVKCDYKSDVEPFYGLLEDPHHSACWRAYRNHHYEKFLKSKNER